MAVNINLTTADPGAAYNSGNVTVCGSGIKVIEVLGDLKGRSAADTFTFCKLPAYAAVINCSVTVLEAAGETCTMNVGYQTGASTVGATFVSAVDLNATAGTVVHGSGTDIIEGSNIQTAFGATGNAASSAFYVGGVLATVTSAAQGKFIVKITVLMP